MTAFDAHHYHPSNFLFLQREKTQHKTPKQPPALCKKSYDYLNLNLFLWKRGMKESVFILQTYLIQIVLNAEPSFLIRPLDPWKLSLCCALWFKVWHSVKLIAPWETKGDYPDRLDTKHVPLYARWGKGWLKWINSAFIYQTKLGLTTYGPRPKAI